MKFEILIASLSSPENNCYRYSETSRNCAFNFATSVKLTTGDRLVKIYFMIIHIRAQKYRNQVRVYQDTEMYTVHIVKSILLSII